MDATVIKDAQCDIFCRCIMAPKKIDILNKSWMIMRKALFLCLLTLTTLNVFAMHFG